MRRRRETAAAPPDISRLEAELQALKERQLQLRQQIKRVRTGGTGIRKLEEKLANQLATAKWTVRQIHELQPDWDELEFYRQVQAKEPAQRIWRRQRREEAASAPPDAGPTAEHGIEEAAAAAPEESRATETPRRPRRSRTGSETPTAS